MNSQEVTMLIRRWLTKAHEAGDTDAVPVEQLGSHSCKRTLLRWCAVGGLSLDNWRLLGHHVVNHRQCRRIMDSILA